MTYTDEDRAELLQISGQDGNALRLVDALFDCALNETPVGIETLRAHCAPASSQVDNASMDFLLATIPEYISEWVWAKDEADAQSWFKEVLAGLFRLRTGRFECRTCLRLGYRLNMLNPRMAGYVDCVEHRELTLHDLVAPRTPLLRAVPHVA